MNSSIGSQKKKKASVDGPTAAHQADQGPSSSTASTSKPKVDGKEGEKRYVFMLCPFCLGLSRR